MTIPGREAEIFRFILDSGWVLATGHQGSEPTSVSHTRKFSRARLLFPDSTLFFNPLGHVNWNEQIFFRLDIRILRIILSISTKNQLRSMKHCRDSRILRNPVVVTFQFRTAQLTYPMCLD